MGKGISRDRIRRPRRPREPSIERNQRLLGWQQRSLKRCGPALPGLTQTVPFLVSILGRCPEMTTSNPDAAGSSVISFRCGSIGTRPRWGRLADALEVEPDLLDEVLVATARQQQDEGGL